MPNFGNSKGDSCSYYRMSSGFVLPPSVDYLSVMELTSAYV